MFSFSTLITSVKPLRLISVIAPEGMLDLSSTLGLTPSVKPALDDACKIDVRVTPYGVMEANN
jgi:hypothetical protein